MPGTASSSSSRRPGEPGQPVVAGERVRGEVDRRPAARPGAPQQPDQLRRRQAAGAAQREPLARPLGGRQLADRPAGRSAGSAVDRWSRHRVDRGHRAHAPGPRPTAIGRPRARTTEARRFPPPSGPEDDAEPSERALTGGSPRPFTGGSPAGLGRQSRLERDLGEDQQDPVERRVQPERRPDRAAPEEEPAERERDRDPRRRSRRPRARTPRPRRRPPIGEDVGEGEEQRARARALAGAPMPAPRPSWRTPRNRSSSPNGATIDAGERATRAKPTVVPVGGSGLTGVTGKSWQQDRRRRRP